MAMQDGLTGLANRRQFDFSLYTEVNRAQRNNSSIALILIDVDHFKLYNDLYGHLAGDECLKVICSIINNCKKRPADIAARYGGEEMAVLLPDTDISGAYIVAESIRKEIYGLSLGHNGSPIKVVTVSIGIGAFVELNQNFEPNNLILAADQALYIAKTTGRNRVCTIPNNLMNSI